MKFLEMCKEYFNKQLIDACYDGDLPAVKKILEAGGDPDYNDGQPFIIAVDQQRDDILSELINHGGKSHLNNYVLQEAIVHRYKACCQILIKSGASQSMFENSINRPFLESVAII